MVQTLKLKKLTLLNADLSRILAMEDENLSEGDAMKVFFNSQVFNRLCDIETGLYRESGGYVYDLYKTEKKYGRLVQLEI